MCAPLQGQQGQGQATPRGSNVFLTEAPGTEQDIAVAPLSSPLRGHGPEGHAEKSKNFDKTPGTEQTFAWAPLIAPLQDQGQGPACHA